VRVLGAIGVVEIDGDWQKMLKLRQEFVKYGVFLRPFSNCVYVMPSLNIKKIDLEIFLTNMQKVIQG
jgi:adenosylmethionine---8-amino-7-oxononanoate aminotransferase